MIKLDNLFMYTISFIFVFIFGYAIYNGYEKSKEQTKGSYKQQLESELLFEYCEKKLNFESLSPSERIEKLDELGNCVAKYEVIVDLETKGVQIIEKTTKK